MPFPVACYPKMSRPGNGGGAILPPVAGPLIWLDASQESYANNDPVGQFTDWSGNGNHFTASGTARPTFKTNRINSLPTVQADGVDDGMLLASLAAQTAWTLFFVGRQISVIGGDRNILSVDDYAPDGKYYLFQSNGAVNSSSGVITGVTVTTGLAMSYGFIGNASSSTIRSSDNVSGTAAGNFSKASSAFSLFRRGDGLYTNYEISELLFYGSVLGAIDRTTIWTYFNTRYGTAIPATP